MDKEQICGSDGAFEHRTDRNGALCARMLWSM